MAPPLAHIQLVGGARDGEWVDIPQAWLPIFQLPRTEAPTMISVERQTLYPESALTIDRYQLIGRGFVGSVPIDVPFSLGFDTYLATRAGETWVLRGRAQLCL